MCKTLRRFLLKLNRAIAFLLGCDREVARCDEAMRADERKLR